MRISDWSSDVCSSDLAGDELILATDPDREGEAISWHIVAELNRRKALGGKPVKRVVFNEVTKNAVLDAMRHPRNLDQEIGRASCRERVCQDVLILVVPVSFKQTISITFIMIYI